jgi:hypothetical protein
MQLHDSARAPWWARALAAPAALLRTLALGLVGLFVMAFTLLAGLVGAGVLLVLALVARRKLRREGVRFTWPGRMPRRPGPASWPGRGAVQGRGEVLEAEVREVRD